MFKVVQQVLGKVVQSRRAPTISEAKRRSLVQTKTVANTIVQSVLYNKGFIVAIAEIVDKVVDRAVGEHGLYDIEGV